MKKILYSIAITVFLTANLHAQTGTWGVVLTPNGLNASYNDMIFVTDTIGYVYGLLTPSTNDMEVTTDTGADFNPVTIQSKLRAPNFGSNMAWPTPQNGYVFADTGLYPANSVFVLSTANGGSTWTTSELESNLSLGSICFPSASVGYATGILADGSGDFVAKTTNAGVTWDSIYATTDYALGSMYFINDNNGMFFAQNGDNQLLIGYTTNGGTSFSFRPVSAFSQPTFLHWNTDSSWIVGADSVYRSIDSGKNWTCVIPDVGAGPATVGAFYGDTGFVFSGIQPTVFMTGDAGVTWTASRLPNAVNKSAADSVTPLSASMPSQYVCYLLANDNNATADFLLKISFPIPTGGGGTGAVQTETIETTPFEAVYGTDAITFIMAPAPEARSIQILDVLGRNCASIAVTPNAASGQLPTSALRPGTYFANLGGSVVKFAIP